MATTKRKKTSQPDPPISYLMELTGWQWEYNFGLNYNFEHEDDPPSEHRHLELLGRLLSPANIKQEKMQITIIPGLKMNESYQKKLRPTGLARLSIRDECIDGIIPLPLNILSSVLAALVAKHLKYAAFSGTKIR